MDAVRDLIDNQPGLSVKVWSLGNTTNVQWLLIVQLSKEFSGDRVCRIHVGKGFVGICSKLLPHRGFVSGIGPGAKTAGFGLDRKSVV